MSARFSSPIVLRLPENKLGRDFVIGDIHGCYDEVWQAMKAVEFKPETDRLLCVGDLIDRGHGSARVAKFLSLPYVFSVRGNHEDALLELYEDGEPHEASIDYMARQFGMGWWKPLFATERHSILSALRKLPLIIEVETNRGLVGLLHADVPSGLSWSEFLARVEAGDDKVIENTLWGRGRIKRQDTSGVAGIGRVFVGHTPVDRVTQFGNVYAVDSGAVFGVLNGPVNGHLTLAEATAGTGLLIDQLPEPCSLLNLFKESRIQAPTPFGKYAES